jgi:hypothetical protein
MTIESRFKHHQSVVPDAHAAALLCIAEQIHDLVGLLTNLDQAVEKIEEKQSTVQVRCKVNGKEVDL